MMCDEQPKAQEKDGIVEDLKQQLDTAQALLREAVDAGDWFDGTFHIEMNAHWLDKAKGACGE